MDTDVAPAPAQVYVGVDIAAATCAVAWLAPPGRPSTPRTFEQTPAGFAALQGHLQATGAPPAATHVVMEATSTYWVALAVSLHAAGYRVSVINPARAHYFAKAHLRRAKTDALDAQLLAHLGAEQRPERWEPPPAVYHEARQRLIARAGLVALRRAGRATSATPWSSGRSSSRPSSPSSTR